MSKKNVAKAQTIASKPANIAPKTPTSTAWIWALAIAILTFLLYANTLNHSWALDDYSVIKENYVTQQGISGIPTLLKTEYRYGYWNSPGSLYRPLSLVIFAIEWSISKDNPAIGHFMNVFLFSITAVMVFYTMRKMLDNKHLAIPIVVTLLYAAHPIHSEVVANIKSLDEILAFLFCLISINLLVRYNDTKSIFILILSILSYGLAMFSKESAITFLAVFPLVLILFRNQSIPKSLITGLLYLIPAGLFLFVRNQVLHGQIVLDQISPLDNVLVNLKGFDQKGGAFAMIWIYFQTMLFPTKMVSEFGLDSPQLTGWGDWRAILGLLISLGLGVLAYLNWNKNRIITFGILFFFITFSVSSNLIIMIGTNYGERLLHAPHLGFLLLIGGLMYPFLYTNEVEKLSLNPSNLFSKHLIVNVLIYGFIVYYAFLTLKRNPDWKDSVSLYKSDLKTAPNCAKLNFHYALELNKEGQLAKGEEQTKLQNDAIKYFEKSISIYPIYSDAFAEMGLAYYYKNDIENALLNYKKTLTLRPNAEVYSNMGTIYFNQNKLEDAKTAYEKAIAIDPRFVDARRNLGVIFATNKQYPQAIEQWKEALKYKTDSAILYYYLGSAYRDSGDEAQSKPYFDKAYSLDPKLRK